MSYLKNNGNILHLKQALPGRKTRAGKNIGNTVAYDVKSCQVKITIVNFN